MSEVELTISSKSKDVSPLRLVLTLAFAGAMAGFVLALVYQVTKPIIDANNARELEAAVFKVLPGTEAIQKFVWRDEELVVVPRDEVTNEPAIFGGYKNNGEFVGYAIPGAGAGFQDTIRLLYGYDPARQRVLGMWVLESRETPGLGDKIWKDESFLASFNNLEIEPRIEIVKDEADAANEVDAITGATISSKAVVSIINSQNTLWLDRLPPPGQEPPFEMLPESEADPNVTNTSDSVHVNGGTDIEGAREDGP